MNIKGVSQEAMTAISRYSRRGVGEDTASAAQKNPTREFSNQEIAEVVDRLNSGVRDMHERLSFSYHEKTHRIVVRVLNRDTNEVIREIPPREAIKLLEHIQDFLGMIVDEQR